MEKHKSKFSNMDKKGVESCLTGKLKASQKNIKTLAQSWYFEDELLQLEQIYATSEQWRHKTQHEKDLLYWVSSIPLS